MVWFHEGNYHDLIVPELQLRWDKTNLTVDESAKVRVSIWGYREDTVEPKMEYINMLAVNSLLMQIKHAQYLNLLF
jgi:sushi domain-containing protein 2